jgi:hypothetical protein
VESMPPAYDPSGAARTMDGMWFARLVCSDVTCPEELELYADTLEELETFSCDCGCALQVVGWADAIDDEAALAVVLAAAA